MPDQDRAAHRYRVGSHYGIHVYDGDRPVATFHDAAEAALFVGLAEALAESEATVARVEALVDAADNVAERALSRVFGGGAFPAILDTRDLRAALADPEEPPAT